jgi:outer membrane porin, OprD family
MPQVSRIWAGAAKTHAPDLTASGKRAWNRTACRRIRGADMRSFASWRSALVRSIIVAGLIMLWVGAGTQSRAQTSNVGQTNQAGGSTTLPPEGDAYSELLPPEENEIADQEPLSWTLAKFPSQPYMREYYWQLPSYTPAFFRDSLLQIVARTYDFTRNNSDGSKSQAWTAGGWIAFRSGLIGDIFGVHAALYTSEPLFAPADEGGTRLLTPEQGALNMLGQAYARAQFYDQEFRVGRQLVDTPLINPQDNRMVPNTFEGITLVSLPDKDRSYDYAVGYLTDVKQRDSNDFIPMSDALASSNNVENQGSTFGMLRYRPFAGLSTVFMDYFVQDFINTGFAQAEYDFKLPKEIPNLIIGANVIDQQSVGNDMLTGTSFQTYQASAKVQMAYAGWTLFAAGSVTGDQSNIFSPFGVKPNYTDMQQVSFDNAGEKAIGGSVYYDFGYALSKYGLSGLSVGAWDSQGWGAINPSTGFGIPNRNELDLWVQYRPTEGPLKGFRLKAQYSDLWQEGNVRNPQPEFRIILDYTILVRPSIL